MLICPNETIEETEARVIRIATEAVTERNHDRLLQLWCIVRTAESHKDAGEDRDRLYRLRGRIDDAIRAIAQHRQVSTPAQDMS